MNMEFFTAIGNKKEVEIWGRLCRTARDGLCAGSVNGSWQTGRAGLKGTQHNRGSKTLTREKRKEVTRKRKRWKTFVHWKVKEKLNRFLPVSRPSFFLGGGHVGGHLRLVTEPSLSMPSVVVSWTFYAFNNLAFKCKFRASLLTLISLGLFLIRRSQGFINEDWSKFPRRKVEVAVPQEEIFPFPFFSLDS